jgi:hypothetical protein
MLGHWQPILKRLQIFPPPESPHVPLLRGLCNDEGLTSVDWRSSGQDLVVHPTMSGLMEVETMIPSKRGKGLRVTLEWQVLIKAGLSPRSPK